MQDSNLIWLDLEMTGLDPSAHVIIEIATIITDKHLNVLAEGPVIAIKQSDDELAKMDKWCRKQHTKSGLIERVVASQVSANDACKQTLEFVSQHVPKGESPMCGNSICMDRRFLSQYMPELEEYFHYRNLDVSTIKELAKRWRIDLYNAFKKENKHLALDDIKESIAELVYYRQNFLNTKQ